jgi:hypothetical protein
MDLMGSKTNKAKVLISTTNKQLMLQRVHLSTDSLINIRLVSTQVAVESK